MGHKQQNGKRQFHSSILPSFKPSLPAAEPIYDRTKSKPLRELFPRSSPGVEYFIQYKERLALQIAHRVAHDLLDAQEFQPGDYKLILKPENGGRAAFLFESLRHIDIIGIKLIRGRHNGEEVRVAEIRYKKKTSVAQKGMELELGAPRMKAMMGPDTASDALADLRAAMDDPSVSPRKKEKLSPLLAALEAEKHGQERMFIEACGNDPERVRKAKGIISEISSQVLALEKAAPEIANAEEGDERKMAVASHVGALEICPLCLEPPQAKQLFDSLSKGSQQLLGYVSKSYLTEALPGAYGVAILEHTAIDTINQMQSVLRLMHSQTAPSADAPLCRLIAEFDAKFEQLHQMVAGAARELSQLPAEGAGYGAERWFLKLCSTLNSRRKLLRELGELEKLANRLESKPCRQHMKKATANMAFNLCRAGADETSLLGSFFHHQDVMREMKKWQAKEYRKTPLQKMQPEIERFLKVAAEEGARAEGHFAREAEAEESGGEGRKNGKSCNEARQSFKSRKAEIDAKIYSLIGRLKAEEAAPALGAILEEYFRRSKMHVSYKQLEALCSSPQNMLTRLAIAKKLSEIEPDVAKRKEYGALAERYLDDAAGLFALFWGSHGSRKAILGITKPTRYVQEKGFDVAGDPEKLIGQGNTTSKLVAEYRAVKVGGWNELSFSFMGAVHAIPMDNDYVYDAGYLPFDFGESEKNIRNDIYGRSVPLSELMPGISIKGPQAIFIGLYRLANRNPVKFTEVLEDMKGMEMGNARFPSTIALARNRHSGCVAKYGGLEMENLPLKCDASAKNTFAASFPILYPDAAAGEADAREFILQQVARRAVGSLTVNKARIAREYIRSVLAEKD